MISKIPIAMACAVSLAAGWQAAVATDANPLVGSWTAKASDSSLETTLLFMEDSIIKGPEQPRVPCRYQRDGDDIILFMGENDEPAATVTLSSPYSGELRLADGLVMQLTRLGEPEPPGSASANPATQDRSSGQADSFTRPLGMSTLYEPLGQSLESLLNLGWRLEQVSGARDGFTILLKNGERNALCVLVPPGPEAGATALSDCRRLN